MIIIVRSLITTNAKNNIEAIEKNTVKTEVEVEQAG